MVSVYGQHATLAQNDHPSYSVLKYLALIFTHKKIHFEFVPLIKKIHFEFVPVIKKM